MSNLVVPDQQIVSGVTSTLEWWNLDENGEGVDASGTVTVGITRADGTELVAAGAATIEDTDPDNVGRYTYTLDGTDSTALDMLTVTWSVGGTEVATTSVEVVGRFLFTVREARASHSKLEDSDKYPTADIVRYRAITESELNWICDRSFVPRFARLTLDGTGDTTLRVPYNDLRAVSAVTVDDTAYSAGEVAELKVYQHQRIEQVTGNVWPLDQENVVIAFSYGLDRPFPDLKEAALERFRELLWAKTTGIPRNATSVQDGNGNPIPLAAPKDFETGNRMVDSVYRRRSLRIGAGSGDSGDAAHRPYGRTVSYPPQGSLFRGLRW